MLGWLDGLGLTDFFHIQYSCPYIAFEIQSKLLVFKLQFGCSHLGLIFHPDYIMKPGVYCHAIRHIKSFLAFDLKLVLLSGEVLQQKNLAAAFSFAVNFK